MTVLIETSGTGAEAGTSVMAREGVIGGAGGEDLLAIRSDLPSRY